MSAQALRQLFASAAGIAFIGIGAGCGSSQPPPTAAPAAPTTPTASTLAMAGEEPVSTVTADVKQFFESMPQHFAGIYLVDSRLHVAVAGLSPALERALRESVGSDVEVVPATFSLMRLDQVAAEITADLDHLRERGTSVVAIGTDVPRNRVRIVVRNGDLASSEELIARYPAGELLIEEGNVTATPARGG